MAPPDRLRQNVAHVNLLNLRALRHLVLQRDRIRHHQLLQPALVDHLERGPAEDAVCDDGEDTRRALVEQVARGEAERAARVGHVVHEDGDLALDGPDEDHPRDLVGLFTLFVEEGEVHVEAVGDGCGTEDQRRGRRGRAGTRA